MSAQLKRRTNWAVAPFLLMMPLALLANTASSESPGPTQNAKFFYRVDLDDKKATAPNGAVVNEDYKTFFPDGPFTRSQVIKTRDVVCSLVGYSLSNYAFVEGKSGLIAFDTGNNLGMGKEAIRRVREVAPNAHLPVTHPVKGGEEVVIDGLKVVFHHAVSDTADSLIVHFLELDLVLHNTAVNPTLFSQYTLRGDFYREPAAMIASIDKLRTIRPKYLIGCHGVPITDSGETYESATAHRDTQWD
jgi:alkyl sulfatase BDS1-like metallo-beta-lactamase superfamily hydrolase